MTNKTHYFLKNVTEVHLHQDKDHFDGKGIDFEVNSLPLGYQAIVHADTLHDDDILDAVLDHFNRASPDDYAVCEDAERVWNYLTRKGVFADDEVCDKLRSIIDALVAVDDGFILMKNVSNEELGGIPPGLSQMVQCDSDGKLPLKEEYRKRVEDGRFVVLPEAIPKTIYLP